MVELVDALRSGRSIRKDVPVRVRPSALDEQTNKGERWHQPSFPFFASAPVARSTWPPSSSPSKRGGPDVIWQRCHPKDVSERTIGGGARLVHKVRGAGEWFSGRFRDPGAQEEHTCEACGRRLDVAPYRQRGGVRPPALAPLTTKVDARAGVPTEYGGQLVRDIGRGTVIECVALGSDEADRPCGECELPNGDWLQNAEGGEPRDVRPLGRAQQLTEVR
mgnify:CR=1 FL=1